MYNIALFSSLILDYDSLALKKYQELIDQNLINNPTIFCDNYTILINENIAVFASLYMKQKFKDYIIMTDLENITYVDKSLKNIIVYNEICQEPPTQNNNIYYIPYEKNIIDLIKEIYT